jgi:hypothetical protein
MGYMNHKNSSVITFSAPCTLNKGLTKMSYQYVGVRRLDKPQAVYMGRLFPLLGVESVATVVASQYAGISTRES